MVLWLKEGKEKNCENVDVLAHTLTIEHGFPGIRHLRTKVLLRINELVYS